MKLQELLGLLSSTAKEIGGSTPYICGGVPRDRLLRNLANVSDLDITTGDKTVDYLSQEFFKKLKKDFNIIRKTMEDGHSSVFLGKLKIDFSSNFNIPGIEQILIKQGITKPTSLQKEVFSRDFTCNSLLLSLDLKTVSDLTNRGKKDINDKVIRTCLSPEITLTSNRNRVIRAIYLSSKLGFEIDPAIISFVSSHPQTVKIGTQKSLEEKLNEAFRRDGDRAADNLSKMNLWSLVPITQIMYPWYKALQGKS